MQRHPFPVSISDARGHVTRLEEAPQRIVSIVPSQTELLDHLGLRDRIVGVTRFCTEPDGLKDEITIVGGTKQVRVDRVASLEPDLILANHEENTREDVAALSDVAPVYVTDVSDLNEAFNMIRTVGRLTGKALAADGLVAEVRAQFMELPAFPPLRVAYLIWRDPYMTVGADTFIHDMLQRAGCVNVFSDQRRYPEVTAEDLRAARPEVILLSSEPYPFSDEHRDELHALLPRVPAELVDGQPFSWYGSHLLETPGYLKTLRDRLPNAPNQ